MLFLVEIESLLPPDMCEPDRAALIAAERAAGRRARAEGRLRHIWRVPGTLANVAVWDAADADELHELLTALPAWRWMTVSVRPLATHPLDTPAGG